MVGAAERIRKEHEMGNAAKLVTSKSSASIDYRTKVIAVVVVLVVVVVGMAVYIGLLCACVCACVHV